MLDELLRRASKRPNGLYEYIYLDGNEDVVAKVQDVGFANLIEHLLEKQGITLIRDGV